MVFAGYPKNWRCLFIFVQSPLGTSASCVYFPMEVCIGLILEYVSRCYAAALGAYHA